MKRILVLMTTALLLATACEIDDVVSGVGIADDGVVETLAADGLPAGFVDAHTLSGQSSWWDALTVIDRAFAIPDPDEGPILGTTNSGARASGYWEMGANYASMVRVGCWWSGETPFEGTPLIHINPDAAEFGVGAWPIAGLYGGFWHIATVGRRPDQYNNINSSKYFPMTGFFDGKPHYVELVSAADNTVSLWIDGVRRTLLQSGHPTTDLALPANLSGATKHGIALDVNQHPDRPPNTRVVLGPIEISKAAKVAEPVDDSLDSLLGLVEVSIHHPLQAVMP
jgi:hypothetical protein